jgi:hypothetical protein
MNRAIELILALLLVLMLVADRAYVRELSSYPMNEESQYHNKATHNQQKAESPFLSLAADIEDFIAVHEKTFIVLSTIAIAWFTGTLWRATTGLQDLAARQAADMKKSLRIAEIAADAAKQNAYAAKDQVNALIQAERARIFVEVSLDENIITASDGAKNSVKVKIWNYGKTPASISMIRAYCLIERDRPEQLVKFPGSDKRLPPGLGLATDCAQEESVELMITDDDWANVQRWDKNWYCVGNIVYFDIFGRERITGFCWRYLWHMQHGRFVFDRESSLNYQT